MASAKNFWEFICGPRLFKIFSDARLQAAYEPNRFERWGDQVIHSLYIIWNIGLYTSPVVATVLYRRGYFIIDSLGLVTKVLISIGIVLSTSYFVRGIGRLYNPAYSSFLDTLSAARRNLTKEHKKLLNCYDFEFDSWPVEFRWDEVESTKDRSRVSVERLPFRGTVVDSVVSLPCRILSYLLVNTFGLKMVYPGSIRTMQCLMSGVITQGRSKLVEHGGKRYKLRTRDNNDIDSMLVDRRGIHANGSTLVICCEGNAGFYELGIMMTPIEANYSVLGWNHPGFGGSTGYPYPSQEQNAVDCVMQFAIHKLGFLPGDIILFGWSIGGYSSTWAAMNYPDIKGLILDATFDDILYLAIPRMPKSWESLVRRTIRDHINLNIVDQVLKYNGPVTFVRRTEDEVICTEDGNLSTNRGNHLVAKFLKFRFPNIMDDKRQTLLNEWLASDSLQQSMMWDRYHVNPDVCLSQLASYLDDHSPTYPMLIGDNMKDEHKTNLALFLAEKHLKNYKSTHCTPLPVSMFRSPWAPDSSFVKL